MTQNTNQFEEMTGSELGGFSNVRRDYDMAEVNRLSISVHVEHSLARRGADKLWSLLNTLLSYICGLGVGGSSTDEVLLNRLKKGFGGPKR
jgi:isocitrate lyase